LEQIAVWNQKEPEEIDRCVHEIFEQFALTQPDKLAVHGWNANLTYAQLNCYAINLAHALVSYGVVPGMYIPFCFEKSAWTLVAMIAIMKAGAIFVPIDPSHPQSRVQNILMELDAKLILSSPSNAKLWDSRPDIKIIVVDEDTVTATSEVPVLLSKISSNTTAYVLFTS
jgi:non-ribosomal peptide synthetase component F